MSTDLTQEFNLQEFPEPARSTILAALTEIVLAKLAEAAYERLSESDRAELEKLPESTDPQTLLNFLHDKVPGLDGLADTIIAEEKAELSEKIRQMVALIRQESGSANSGA
jgi:hypothetical protein